MNPVLFLTGKSDIRDKVEGLQQGGDYYLTKPYNFDEFLAVIQMLLERQKTNRRKNKKKNFRLPARSPSEACGWIFRTVTHISIIPTQVLPVPNSPCCVSLPKTRRRFFLQRNSMKQYGAAVREQIPARYDAYL